MADQLQSAVPVEQQPPGATGIQEGPDGKMYFHDVAGKQLGLAPENIQNDDTGTQPSTPAEKPLFDMSKAEPINAKPLFDMSKAQPIDAKPLFDMSKAQPTQAPSPGTNAGPAKGTRFESYANLGNYFFSKPMEGEENKGITHSIHSFLSYPNALYHAFRDPGTDVEKSEILQKINQENAQAGTQDPKHPNHIPETLATNPSSVTLALHRLVSAPADELNRKADRELETARDLWDKRKDWDVSVPTGAGVSIPLGTAIGLSQSISGAADKVLSAIPMLGPLVNGISEKFENGDISGGLTDIALLKAAEHAHGKLTGEPSATPSRVFTDKGAEWGKATRAAVDAAKKSIVEKFKPDISDTANKARQDFQKAAPPSKAAPYDDNDYEIVRRTAEEGHKADKLAGGEGISGIESARDIVEDGRQKIEEKRAGAVKTHADKPIITNVAQDVANALAEADKVTPGFRDEGMAVLEKHNLKDPTVAEADAIRKKLVADNRGIQKKNMWDVMTARQTDPTFAAREAAIDSLRKGIYGALSEAGVPEAYDWARDESAHIRVRDAIERQLFNAEKTVRGTSGAGPMRKIAAGAAKTGTAALGTGVGATIGGVPGAIIGGATGTVVGEGISKAILPPDMTRDALMARSFEPEVATPQGPTVPLSQDTSAASITPNIPPPAPIPPVMPPPDHALHAALATRVGKTVEKSNFDQLMGQFQRYLERTPSQSLTDSDKNLLQQLNESQANRRMAVEEAMKKAVEQNNKAREKWQSDVTKTQEKAVSETKTAAEEAEKEKQEKEAAGLNTNIATPFDTEDELTLPANYAGRGLTGPRLRAHELGHQIMADEFGHPTGDVISHLHPKIGKTAAAEARWDKSAFQDENGKWDHAKMIASLPDILAIFYGGPVAEEIAHGVPIEKNTGAKGDLARVKGILKEFGFSPTETGMMSKAAEMKAREVLTTPGVKDIIQRYTGQREAGLDEGLHMHPETIGRAVQEVRQARGGGNGPSNKESNIGRVAKSSGEAESGRESKIPNANAEGARPANEAGASSGSDAGRERGIKTEIKDKDTPKITDIIPELKNHPEIEQKIKDLGFEDVLQKEWMRQQGQNKTPMEYRPSEKAETMSAHKVSVLGPEFIQAEQSHESDRLNQIIQDPRASVEDKKIARQRLKEGAELPPNQVPRDLKTELAMEPEEFKSWFGKSKIADASGKPMTAYHGTTSPIDFDEFSTDGAPTDNEGNAIIGSSGDPNAYLGAHFAIGDNAANVANKFATNKEGWMRSRYEGENPKPRVIPAYLKIENPIKFKSESGLNDFIYRTGKISNDELLNEAAKSDGIENPEEGGPEIEAWQERYDNDPDFRQEQNEWILRQTPGSLGYEDSNPLEDAAAELGQQAKAALKAKGHDGIVYKNDIEGGHAAVAFEPEQIKSGIQNKGTAEKVAAEDKKAVKEDHDKHAREHVGEQ